MQREDQWKRWLDGIDIDKKCSREGEKWLGSGYFGVEPISMNVEVEIY